MQVPYQLIGEVQGLFEVLRADFNATRESQRAQTS
jgi:hypothetical protein